MVNLEQEKLGRRAPRAAGRRSREYNRILSDRENILDIIREDLRELKRKHADPRRTEISGEEIGDIDLEDLITEETMVVSISSNGYIKRTPASAYRAQHRGGKGLNGAKTEEEDPIQHLFVASTHAYLLFFTNQGQGLLAQGLRPAAVGPRQPRPGGRQPAEPGRGRADRRLPRGPRLRPARPLPGHGHRARAGEEDAAWRPTAGR